MQHAIDHERGDAVAHRADLEEGRLDVAPDVTRVVHIHDEVPQAAERGDPDPVKGVVAVGR